MEEAIKRNSLPKDTIILGTPVDWEQRRYEIAKEMLPVIYLDDGQEERTEKVNGHIGFEYKVDEAMAKEAVRLADALIAELKNKKS